MTQRERQQLIEWTSKESENNEIRLNAYKSEVMSGVSAHELNQSRCDPRPGPTMAKVKYTGFEWSLN